MYLINNGVISILKWHSSVLGDIQEYALRMHGLENKNSSSGIISSHYFDANSDPIVKIIS